MYLSYLISTFKLYKKQASNHWIPLFNDDQKNDEHPSSRSIPLNLDSSYSFFDLLAHYSFQPTTFNQLMVKISQESFDEKKLESFFFLSNLHSESQPLKTDYCLKLETLLVHLSHNTQDLVTSLISSALYSKLLSKQESDQSLLSKSQVSLSIPIFSLSFFE